MKTSLKQVTLPTVALLVFLTILPYLFSLHYPFVYDDHGQIVENPYLLNPAHVGDLLTLQTLDEAHVVNGRRPLVLLTYFTDQMVWGRHAFGFHLTNLLLHAGVVVLLYLLIKRRAEGLNGRGGRNMFAFTVALLFGVHPVLSEAVHVPSFRPDLLYVLFILLHLRIGLSFPRLLGASWLARVLLSALTMLAALASKEAGAVAPLLLAGMWVCFPGTRPRRGTMTVLLAVDVVLLLVFAVLCAGGAPMQATSGSWNGLSLKCPANLFTGPWIFLKYIALLVWPHPLIADRVVAPLTTLLTIKTVAGLVFLAGWAAIVIGCRKARPWLSFSAGWLLVCYLPVANILPLINPMAERYLYGMAIGYALLLAYGLSLLPPARFQHVGVRQILLSVLCAAYVAVTFTRLQAWRSDLAIWSDNLARQPESARATTWVGLEQKRAQQLDDALASFEQAVRLNPQHTEALVNQAIIIGQQGDLAKAEALLREAIRRRPEKPGAYWNLAVDLELQGRDEEVVDVLREGLRLDPLNTWLRSALAERLRNRGERAEALAMFEAVLAVDPSDERAQNAVRELRFDLGPKTSARDDAPAF